MCPRERLVLISISTVLSFAKKGLVHLLHLFVTSVTCSLFCYPVRKPLKFRLLSIHGDFLLHTVVQHLLVLVGIDTPIYRKYYDTPPILVGHHPMVRELCRHDRDPSQINNQKRDLEIHTDSYTFNDDFCDRENL